MTRNRKVRGIFIKLIMTLWNHSQDLDLNGNSTYLCILPCYSTMFKRVLLLNKQHNRKKCIIIWYESRLLKEILMNILNDIKLKNTRIFISIRGRNTHSNIFDSFSYNNNWTKIFQWIERSCMINFDILMTFLWFTAYLE